MSILPFSLPPKNYRQPVVLVCGDALPELFGVMDDEPVAVRMTGQGCYLAVPDVQDLAGQVVRLLRARPDWRSQLSLLLVSNPQTHADGAALQARLSLLDYQYKRLRRRGLVLPLWQVSYLQRAGLPGEDSPWFSWQGAEHQPQVYQAGGCIRLADWQQQPAEPAACAQRLHICLQLGSAAQLLARTLQPLPLQPALWAVTFVPQIPQWLDDNLWQQWQRRKTALEAIEPAPSAAPPRLALPDTLLHLLAQRSGMSRAQRRRSRGLWLGTAMIVFGMALSAWQNHGLLRQVSHELQYYNGMAPLPQDDPRREQALGVLQGHATRLDRYQRNGEPLYLGLGLYRGADLRIPLQQALTAQPPPAPMPTEVQTVRLDSLSLFDTGSARLKPESAKVLINALVGIKARPGWLIVIAGHTDAVGDAQANQQLSQARAAAVRDWMQRMGDIAPDCFAVQGVGASQPVASNEHETGRAANRRVDIRLVPAAGACALPASPPATPVAIRDIQ